MHKNANVSSQVHNSTGANGISAISAARQKMNSTMVLKFNQSTDKGINQRGNLNKSTLLPSNISQHANQQIEGQMTTLSNSRNLQMKRNMNIDVGGANVGMVPASGGGID